MVMRIFSLFLLSLLSFGSIAANITVQVDRDPVSINESFKIIFEADSSVSTKPDFTALQQDFEILSRNQSNNVQFINGSITKQTRWTLFAMAKRTGKLNIPSIRIGNDNSPAISITVYDPGASNNAATENKEMFVQVEATPTSTYVQSQILYTMRFYRAININGASMSEPSFAGSEVVMEKLGDDSSFETQINGRRHIVIERRYALFPQQSGTLTIEPITLDVQVPVVARGIFDPFGQNSTTKRLKSKSIELDISPIPSTAQSNTWLPASELRLTENWSQDPAELVVGEPITRTLTLKAEGLTAAQLPSLAMKDSRNYKAYPDQPRLNDKRGSQGISGTRQEKIAIIPTWAGQLTLPEIEIKWWNVNTNLMETAILLTRTVQVGPGATPTQTAQAPVMPQTSLASTEPMSPQMENVTIVKQERGLFTILSIVLGLGWLITAIAWFSSNRKQNNQTTGSKVSTRITPTRPLLNSLKRACINNNPTQTKTELLNWSQAYWPENPPTNLSEIGNRLDKQTQHELEKLNLALYGLDNKTWQGSALWQAISVAVKTKKVKKNKEEKLLIPLYP